MKKILAWMLALTMLLSCFALAACSDDTPDTPDTPGTTDPGTETPGTTDPGTETPGTTDPGTETPGEDEGNKEEEEAAAAAQAAAAPVIALIQALGEIPEVTADNLADLQAKYDEIDDAYKALEKDARNIVNDSTDNRAAFKALKDAIDAYETKLKVEKLLTEYYTTLAALPTTGTVKGTIEIDGILDYELIDKGATAMTLTKEQCDAWNEEGRSDGAGVVGDTSLTEGAETDVSFYVLFDDDYLYIIEWRCDLNWCFSAQDYTKSYAGDGSLLWFSNTGKADQWLASGSMSSSPEFGLMWNAGVGGEAVGENKPQIAYFPGNDQSAPVEKTASGQWQHALGWDEDNYSYVLEVAIPWSDLPFTAADMAEGNISATFCSVDIVNPEFDGDTSKLWTGMGYQMQFPGVNNWHLSYPLIPAEN